MSSQVEQDVEAPLTFDSIFGRFRDGITKASSEQPFRLGILGGTFDPIHIGHLLLAQFALEQHKLDGVLFVPCNYPFYKLQSQIWSGLNGPASAEQRVKMLQLALADSHDFEVSRVEVDRTGPSYTVDTIRLINEHVFAEFGDNRLQLFLILGADAMVDLPNWRESKAITDAVTVLYAKRPGTDSIKLETAAQSESIKALPVDVLPLDVSSTVLRSRVAAGRPIRHFTPQAVIDYIATQGLYLPLETEA